MIRQTFKFEWGKAFQCKGTAVRTWRVTLDIYALVHYICITYTTL